MLVNFLADDPENQITVLDDLSSGHLENVGESPRIRFVQGRIDSDEDLDKVFDVRIDDVFHMAANFANQNSVEYPQRDLQVNGMGTLKILSRAAEQKVRRVIYASSSCVYGDRGVPLSEEMRDYSLDTPYGITKLLGERYMAFFHRHHDLPVVILRFFNVYGPNEYPGRYRNVIANFLHKAMNDDVIEITGTGEETRDFNFTDDTVRGILLAAETEAATGETFNIASGRETRIRDLVGVILDITGSRSEVVFRPRRTWDSVTRRVAAVEKAEMILGYRPEIRLEDGLARYWKWLKNQDIRKCKW